MFCSKSTALSHPYSTDQKFIPIQYYCTHTFLKISIEVLTYLHTIPENFMMIASSITALDTEFLKIICKF